MAGGGSGGEAGGEGGDDADTASAAVVCSNVSSSRDTFFAPRWLIKHRLNCARIASFSSTLAALKWSGG